MSTEYKKIEPIGFGRMPLGDKSTDTDEIEFGRGFGDKTTPYSEDNDD